MNGVYAIASGTGGKRAWRVVYHPDPADWANPHQELYDARHNLVRYASITAATKRADDLNRVALPPVRDSEGFTHAP